MGTESGEGLGNGLEQGKGCMISEQGFERASECTIKTAGGHPGVATWVWPGPPRV